MEQPVEDRTITVQRHDGPRDELRPLFELAEDSAIALNAYLHDGLVLVATADEAVVGHLQLTPARAADTREIKNMAVIEARQGSGIGRQLVSAACELAKGDGAERLVVSTAAADVGNLRFYQRQGFRMLAIERDAFTPATGYPSRVVIEGIELRDRVWLDRPRVAAWRALAAQAHQPGNRVSDMTSVRIEALDPTDPRSQAAITQFLNEMVERVGADVLEIDVAQEAKEDSGKNFFVVALDDRDNVVGCGSLRQVEPKVGQIGRLWVNQVLRGRSIGRRMLSALEGAGAVAGFEFIRLEVYEALSEAVLLFETSGYMQVDPWEQSPPDLRAYQKQLVAVVVEGDEIS